MTAMDQSVYDSLDYLPFGEQIAGGSGTTHKFTGKERDSESGLDNFGARYNASNLGRFMSPDPDNVSGLMNQDDPQSWNGYAYARNNPLRYTDADGQNVVVCIQGQDKCHDYTDDQYKRLLAEQNGKQGINLPDQALPHGDITCGGVKCGTANFYEPGLDPSDNFTIVGAIGAAEGAGAIIGAVRTATGVLSGLKKDTGPTPPAATANQGAYGTASRVQNLNGLSRQDADAALKARNPVKVHTTKGGYTEYKFEDGSTVWIRTNGEVVRVPAPGTAPPGSRIDPGGNLTGAHSTGEKIGP
jgi:RHS repeat-associated protein